MSKVNPATKAGKLKSGEGSLVGKERNLQKTGQKKVKVREENILGREDSEEI